MSVELGISMLLRVVLVRKLSRVSSRWLVWVSVRFVRVRFSNEVVLVRCDIDWWLKFSRFMVLMLLVRKVSKKVLIFI